MTMGRASSRSRPDRMKPISKVEGSKPRRALLAADMMSRPLVCVRQGDSMRHAASLLIEKNISGAAVVDGRGRPVGVLTKTDIARYERDRRTGNNPLDDSKKYLRTLGPIEAGAQGVGLEPPSEQDAVFRWMTPRVISVSATASVQEIAREMLRRRIHRVFVKTAKTDALLGVVTTLDVLRCCLSCLDS